VGVVALASSVSEDRRETVALTHAEAARIPRRFPPPWSVEETAVCFVVRDSSGQKLAYVNFEEESGRRNRFPQLKAPTVDLPGPSGRLLTGARV
jgi:hypothetical protein